MTDYITHESFRDMLWDCIIPMLNLEDVCYLLMTTTRLWNQRTKLDSLSFQLREDTITIYRLKNIPEEWLNKIHSLNLFGARDMSVLNKCKNLYNLNLSYVTFKNFPKLWCQTLHTLDLFLSKLTDITALGDLPNLHTLFLCHSEVIDISALGRCQNLYNLNISYTNITDISGLSNCHNLHALIMSHTEIKNISILSGCKNLDALCINHTKVEKKSAPKVSVVCSHHTDTHNATYLGSCENINF